MAEILFMPVCSNCGTILTNMVYIDAGVEPIPYANDELYVPGYMEVRPRRCPRCNHIFSLILMPTSLPFRGYGNEKGIKDYPLYLDYPKSYKQPKFDCEKCRYYPPSSLDGKPCTQCDPSNPLMNCFSQKEEAE